MKKIQLSILTTLLTSLIAQSDDLQKVTVTTPNKTIQYLKNITSDVDIITNDEIEERDFRTLSDALITHSGFSISRNGGIGQTTSIFLRGFDSKRTLVLIDGVRYNDPTSLNGASFEHILLDNVEKIEIVKGAQSGIWGADASAGVINIITKKPTKDGVSASIHAEYGSFNTQTHGLNAAFKKDKFDIALNLERITSDGFSAKVADGKKAKDFEDDGYENNTMGVRVGTYISDKDRVEAFYNYIDSSTDFDGYDLNATKAANDPLSKADSTEKFYGASYQRFEENYSAKLYYQKSDFSRSSKSGGFTSNFDGSVDESGINGEFKVSNDLTIGGGADLKKFKHKNKIGKDFTNKGVFLTLTNTIHEEIGDTILNGVVRYDNFDLFDNKTTYRVGFKHTPANHKELNIFANYSTGYNTPTLYQLYDSYAGNKNLNPEKTSGYDLGVKIGGLKVSYFSNKIKDLIDYKTTDFKTFTGSYFNLKGDSTFKGLELSYNGILKESDLKYNLNYTYLKTKDNNGKELARRPKNSANLALDYYGLVNTHLGALISYVGKRKKSQYDKNPKTDYKSYTLVDLIAEYDLNDATTIYAKVENALDKDYELISGYGVSPRAYYVGFRYRVK